MVGIINAGEYARAIHDAWLRRQLIDLGETVVNNAFGAEPELDGRAQIEVAEQSLFDLSNRGGEQGGFMTFERALAEAVRSAEAAFKRTGHVSGISTGLRDLDGKMGGLHPSDLVILAGRPGMGKTALATKIAYGAARAMLEDARRTSPDAQPDVKPPGRGRGLFVGDERRAALHPSAGRAGARVRRPDPPRRDRAEGLRPLLPSQPRTAIAADPHRRHAGDHAVGDAHALPAAQAAVEGPVAGGGGLPSAHAPVARHQAGEPRAGDQQDHPGAEGAGQGVGGAGARSCRARSRAARTSARSCRTCARAARSSRTPTW